MQLKFLKKHHHDSTSQKALPSIEDILGCVSKYKNADSEAEVAAKKVEKKRPEKQFLKR